MLLVLLVCMVAGSRDVGGIRRTTSKVDIDTTGIFLRRILKTKFTTDSLNTGFNFLDMVRGMVSLADDPAVDRRLVYLPFPNGYLQPTFNQTYTCR